MSAVTATQHVIDLSSDCDREQPLPSQKKISSSRFLNLSDSLDELDDFMLEPSRKRQRSQYTEGPQLTTHEVSTTHSAGYSATVKPTMREATLDVFDDITSSPPDCMPRRKNPGAGAGTSTTNSNTNPSTTTAALGTEITSTTRHPNRTATAKAGLFKRVSSTSRSSRETISNAASSSYHATNIGSKAAGTRRDKTADRLAKDADAERKRLAKEAKVLERQRAAEFTRANQPRQRDKKSSSAAMIIEVPTSLEGSQMIANAKEKLREIQAEIVTAEQDVENAITWRRRVNTKFNEEAGHWELTDEHIIEEQHVLCYFAGKDMCEILLRGTASGDLDEYVARARATFGNRRLLFVFQGVDSALKKFQTNSNKAYRSAVRQGTAVAADALPQDLNAMTDSVEESLMHLQTVHGVCVLQTADDSESAEWLVTFTEQISLMQSRVEKDHLEADFCMELGQIASGDNARDTFVKMLQQVIRVTAPIAYGIAAAHPDVPSLQRAFENEGPLALQDIKKCANSDGAFTDARIGPQVSRRLAQIFLENDPDMVEL